MNNKEKEDKQTNKQKDLNTENKLMVARGERVAG